MDRHAEEEGSPGEPLSTRPTWATGSLPWLSTTDPMPQYHMPPDAAPIPLFAASLPVAVPPSEPAAAELQLGPSDDQLLQIRVELHRIGARLRASVHSSGALEKDALGDGMLRQLIFAGSAEDGPLLLDRLFQPPSDAVSRHHEK